ncbi:hypothetical protein CASFOL_004067 [Castilleja foliolosa]|uniref:Alpha/beta hydrolase fold-3 domain-containing protein n=1 Tax=Castilleja foliolosa TaxID=1961234 RepID=A0ABD3EM97_9LAMI
MSAMTLKQNLGHQISPKDTHQTVDAAEEIDGLIRVYKDGHVERPQIVPCVPPSLAPDLGVTCRDTVIDSYTNVWARVYCPDPARESQLPVLVYFHGGGFCVGSACWRCYHEFLAKLAAKANCAVVSVNYRLAPENPLPAAYDDGVKAVVWVRQQVFVEGSKWWARKCNFESIFLCGDSAGANIAYNVAVRLKAAADVKGLILIQPFFGGERRTYTEEYMAQPPRSALTVSASDAYWRLALPAGADRDHPWCNPPPEAAEELERGTGVLVCVSEMDILKDRNLEFCGGLAAAGGGRRIEKVVFEDVGHAFQILNKSGLSEIRVHEMICRVKDFVTR